MPRRLAALLVTLLVVTAACGSTVQQEARPGVAVGGGELGGRGAGSELGAPEVSPTTEEVGAPGGGNGTGSGTGIASGGTTQTGGGATGSASATPGAGDTSPLRLGMLYVNNDAAASAGVDNGNTFTTKQVLEALVRSVNAKGGLGGRKVQPSYFEIKSSSSSYASDLQAACAQFVQDDHVHQVMSFLGGLIDEQFSTCLSRAGVVHLTDGLGDDKSMADQPTAVSPMGLSADHRVKAVLEQLTASGFLTRQSKLGVLIEGCPYNERAVQRTLDPTAERLGLTLAARHSTKCFGSINDLGTIASDAQNAVLQFRSRNVDRVVFVSGVEGNLMFLFATAANSQGFHPGYGLSSLAYPEVVKGNVPQEELTNTRGLGWLPATDDGTTIQTAETRACLATLKEQGLVPAAAADYLFAYTGCDAFALTDRVLKSSRGASAPAPWFSALHGIGTGFRTASTVDGRTDFSGGRRDGPAASRIFAWNGGCSCFRYTGSSAGL